jgi:putative ABC transport system permease protein
MRTLADGVWQDLHYSLRMLRRGPMFSLTAGATVALSTAAIATVATLADTLLWRRLAVAGSDRLVSITATRDHRRTDGAVSYPDYVAFRDRATTVSALAAHYSTAPLFVAVGSNAAEVNGAVVSANYFPLFEMRPVVGRFFHADEDRIPDRDRVAVIGYDFWQSWFGGSAAAVGSMMTINGVTFTIIGIAPPQPAALTPMPVNLYIPTMMLRVGYRWCDDSLAADCTSLTMVGRLSPGRTVAEATAEFGAIMPVAWTHAAQGDNSGVAVRQPRGMSEDDQDPRLIAMLAAVAVVLMIVCCANLGGLLSARTAAREDEFAVRLSLGAGPSRIMRQVVTESLLLAMAGGLGGLVLSRLFINSLARSFFSMDDEGHPLFYDFSQSSSIALITMMAAVVAGVLFSILPGHRVTRRQSLRLARGRSSSARWATGRWLLGAQAASAVALLATAALLTAGARAVLAGRNYDTSHVALMRVRPRLIKYTPDQAQRFQREVIRRVRALPGVESVSMVGIGTILGGGSATAGKPGWSDRQQVTVQYNEVGPAYFATIRTPLQSGREFDERDTVHSPAVAIVNDTLARRFWPDGQAIGSTIVVGTTVRQVVGVVADVSLRSRSERAESWVFTPFWQNPGEIDSRIAVRTAGDPAAILAELSRTVHKVDPNVPIAETITLPVRIAALTRPARIGALFVGYAASLAMLLTAIGLYSTLAFAVSRRTREIGIRLALGAGRGRIVGSIVREGMIVALSGAAFGVLLAVGSSRVLSHLLYGSADEDWMFHAAAALVIGGVALAASLVPARRAAGVEPIVALRHE